MELTNARTENRIKERTGEEAKEMKRWNSLYMSDHSYNEQLKELKQRASNRVKVRAVDSCEIGDKYTECNIGLCDDSLREHADGVYRRWHQSCPHDKRWFDEKGNRLDPGEEDLNGCFHSCRIFKREKSNAYARIEAVELIPEVIEAGDK